MKMTIDRLNDPLRVIGRTHIPILEPETDYAVFVAVWATIFRRLL